jgi:hypothetical protein
MANSIVTRVQQMSVPEVPMNKSLEMPANRPNTAKYMPGDKGKLPGKMKTVRSKRKRRVPE